MKAYDKEYLQATQEVLAAILDVGVYYLNYSSKEFFELLLRSKYAKKIEKGDPFVVWGKSGTEIAFEIADEDIGKYKEALNESGFKLHRSPEYWAGWSLAYYQWFSGKTFAEINEKIDIVEIIHLYNPYHEMDILHFCDRLEQEFVI